MGRKWWTPEQTDLTNQNYLPSVLPALYKTGNYVFKGWYKDEALTIAAAPSAIIGENTTLYAKFEAQSTPKKGYISCIYPNYSLALLR